MRDYLEKCLTHNKYLALYFKKQNLIRFLKSGVKLLIFVMDVGWTYLKHGGCQVTSPAATIAIIFCSHVLLFI